MIDCSIDILNLITNHADEARRTLGLSENESVLLIGPAEGDFLGCLFTDSRVDDYEGMIYVYCFLGEEYLPGNPPIIDSNGNPVGAERLEGSYEDYKIYLFLIKMFSCELGSGLFINTVKERFWVKATLCESETPLGIITDSGRYVQYGGYVTLTALPNRNTYSTTWTDITDPDNPVVISNSQTSCTINNVTNNHRVEVCFTAPPATYTFRLFTNDGKIGGLCIDSMRDGYKLGDVSVSFANNDQQVSLSTSSYGYGTIVTYDFDEINPLNIVDLSSDNEHMYDRGIILYHAPCDLTLSISSTPYSDSCSYVRSDATSLSPCASEQVRNVSFTSFVGWSEFDDEYNYQHEYSDLGVCELHYPEFSYILIPNATASIYDEYAVEMINVPTIVECNSPSYIRVGNLYYQRINNNTFSFSPDVCYYENFDNSRPRSFTFVNSQYYYEVVSLYAIFEPLTSSVMFQCKPLKSLIVANDYCNCNDASYRDIGVYQALLPQDSIVPISELVGLKMKLQLQYGEGETPPIPELYLWLVLTESSPNVYDCNISSWFNATPVDCEISDPTKCLSFEFTVCGNILFTQESLEI